MNTLRSSLALLLVATFGVGAARAQAPLTRADVMAQLQEAARTGELMAPGDSGMKLAELHPDRYPKAAPVAGKTREQVNAELQAALRRGDIVANGDLGKSENELFPQRYPAARLGAGTTRAQVRAETAQAIRTGDIVAAGDIGLKLNERFPQRYAKVPAAAAERATTMAVAASTGGTLR